MSVYRQTLRKSKKKTVITSHSLVVMPQGHYWKLLNLVISAHAPAPPLFLQCHTLQTPSLPWKHLSPPPHPCRKNPGVITGTEAALVLPSWRVPLFLPGRGERGNWMSAVSVRQNMEKVFFAWFGGTCQHCFFHGEGVPGASFQCGWSHSLLIQVAELWADVNHTTIIPRLYSLQDVKLEIAQSSQEIIS